MTEFLAHDHIQYAFRLKEWNDEWRNVGNQQHASYSNLPPGNYTFEVKAKKEGGVGLDTSRMSIIIQTAPWKMLVGIPYLYFDYRCFGIFLFFLAI